MSNETFYYNAYSGMPLRDRIAVVQFLEQHEKTENKENICEALDYALKVKPSFGGFVLVAKEQGKIQGVIVSNCTGMTGYTASHLFVFATYNHKSEGDHSIMLGLMREAIRYAKGQVAMHIPPDHPALNLFQQLGFKSELLALRLDNTVSMAVA
jgi:hypothetical protein